MRTRPSIGDGMHDRFSTNKDIDRAIREKMKENGAIFITGNHDVFHRKGEDCQFGKLAKDNATCEEWKNHQDAVLTNAYFHEEANTLYVHHGLGEDEDGNIITAFGTYVTSEKGVELSKFLEWINVEERRTLPYNMIEGTRGPGGTIGKNRQKMSKNTII